MFRSLGLRAKLALIVLGTEAFVVVLASLALFGTGTLKPAVAAAVGGGVLALIVGAALLSARPFGIAIGWLVQALLLASFALDPLVGVVGLVFAAMWVYCMIVGGRIDRRDAGERRSAHDA